MNTDQHLSGRQRNVLPAPAVACALTAVTLIAGCTLSSVATFKPGAAPSDASAAGRLAGERHVPTLGQGGHTILHGDGAALRSARRILVLHEGWTQRGSATAASVAVETALLRAGKVPLLPPVPGDAPGCCDPSAAKLDTDLERSTAPGALASGDIVLHLSAPRHEETLLVPCAGGALCPATAVGPSQLVDPPPCPPERSYPSARVSTLLARAIDPATGRVLAVIRAVTLPGVAQVNERRFEHGSGSACRWVVKRADSPPDQTSVERDLLGLLVQTLVGGTSVQGRQADPAAPSDGDGSPTG